METASVITFLLLSYFAFPLFGEIFESEVQKRLKPFSDNLPLSKFPKAEGRCPSFNSSNCDFNFPTFQGTFFETKYRINAALPRIRKFATIHQMVEDILY